MVDTLLLRPSFHFSTLHSTSLHMSTLHFLSFKLHPTALHYQLIWLNSICYLMRIAYTRIPHHQQTIPLHNTSTPQVSLHNATSSRKLLKMYVLTPETC